MEAQRGQASCAKITQLKSGHIEMFGNLSKNTQLIFGSTQRSDFLTKITQFRSGNIERLGNLPRSHSAEMEEEREVRQLA